MNRNILLVVLIASIILIAGCTVVNSVNENHKKVLEESGSVIETGRSCSIAIQTGHLRGETEEETLRLSCQYDCGQKWQADYYTYECKADKLRCFCENLVQNK